MSNGPEQKPEEADPSKEKDKKVGWIESLAQRSTGLPDLTRPQTPPPPPAPPGKSPWAYAGLGIQFAGTAVLFTLMGLYVDWKFGWSPWGTVVLSMIGV